MSNIRFVNNTHQIIYRDKWVVAEKFDSKDKIVDYKENRYQIVEKIEHTFSKLERVRNCLLGLTLTVCTFGYCSFFKKSGEFNFKT